MMEEAQTQRRQHPEEYVHLWASYVTAHFPHRRRPDERKKASREPDDLENFSCCRVDGKMLGERSISLLLLPLLLSSLSSSLGIEPCAL